MIVNQKKNASFRSTLEYVLGKEEAILIDTNMGGNTPRQLAAEFAAARRLRPNLKRACGHIIISIPHRDADHDDGEYHEHLDDEQYVALAKSWLKYMEFQGEGLHDSQYLIARHYDTDHEHIHIIASRIRMDGSVVSDSWDYRRSEVVVRQLEKEFGLEAAPCSNLRVATKVREEHGIETTVSDRSALTRKQKHHNSVTPPVKQRLADLIDEVCSDSPSVTQLIFRLQHQGVLVHPQFSTKGLFKEAIAFELDGVKVAGNKLGSAYSFPGLLRKRGVQYDPDRDLPALQAAFSGEVVSLHFSSPLSDTFQLPSTFISSLLSTSQQPTLIQDDQPAPIADATPLVAYLQLFEQESSDAEATIKPVHLTHAPPEPISQKKRILELAQKLYPDIAQVWDRYKQQSKEVQGAQVLKGNNYALIRDSSGKNLWIVHRQRGTLAQYKDGEVELAQRITSEDVENFSQIVEKLATQQLPQPKPQQKKEKSQLGLDLN